MPRMHCSPMSTGRMGNSPNGCAGILANIPSNILVYFTEKFENERLSGKEIAQLICAFHENYLSAEIFYSALSREITPGEFWKLTKKEYSDLDTVIERVGLCLWKICCDQDEKIFEMIKSNITKCDSSFYNTLLYKLLRDYKITEMNPEELMLLIEGIMKHKDILSLDSFINEGLEKIRERNLNPFFVKYLAYTWIMNPINDSQLRSFIKLFEEEKRNIFILEVFTPIFKNPTFFNSIVKESFPPEVLNKLPLNGIFSCIPHMTLYRFQNDRNSSKSPKDTFSALILFGNDIEMKKLMEYHVKYSSLRLFFFSSAFAFEKFPQSKQYLFEYIRLNPVHCLEFFDYFQNNEDFCEEFFSLLKNDANFQDDGDKVTSVLERYVNIMDLENYIRTKICGFYDETFQFLLKANFKYSFPKLNNALKKFLAENSDKYLKLEKSYQVYVRNRINRSIE